MKLPRFELPDKANFILYFSCIVVLQYSISHKTLLFVQYSYTITNRYHKRVNYNKILIYFFAVGDTVTRLDIFNHISS